MAAVRGVVFELDVCAVERNVDVHGHKIWNFQYQNFDF